MHNPATALYVLALLLAFVPAHGEDLTRTEVLNFRFTKDKERTRQTFVADRFNATPEIRAFIEGINAKIGRNIPAMVPRDALGKRLYGRIGMRLTLRKNGLIEDVQFLLESPDDALRKASAEIIKAAQPFPSFPSGLFGENDFLTYETTIIFAKE